MGETAGFFANRLGMTVRLAVCETGHRRGDEGICK